jgi:preprotein translocase subunit SecA
LVEYKREGLKLFKDMEISVDQEIIRILANVQGQVEGGENMPVVELRPDVDQFASVSQDGVQNNGMGSSSQMVANAIREAKVIPVISGQDKVGRNDPCPCGSGKKYKKCHGA